MGYLILGCLLAASIAVSVLALKARQRAAQRARDAEARAEKLAHEMVALKEAYYEEAQRLVRKYSQKSGMILRLAEEKREAFTL